jgi:hypothetical protein
MKDERQMALCAFQDGFTFAKHEQVKRTLHITAWE